MCCNRRCPYEEGKAIPLFYNMNMWALGSVIVVTAFISLWLAYMYAMLSAAIACWRRTRVYKKGGTYDNRLERLMTRPQVAAIIASMVTVPTIAIGLFAVFWDINLSGWYEYLLAASLVACVGLMVTINEYLRRAKKLQKELSPPPKRTAAKS